MVEVAEKKKRITAEEFKNLWETSVSLDSFCAVSGYGKKSAQVRACVLRKKNGQDYLKKLA